MRTRNMVIISVAVYAIFLAILIAVLVMFREDDRVFGIGLYFAASGISVSTLILAVIFIRKTPSERYLEMYGDDSKKE